MPRHRLRVRRVNLERAGSYPSTGGGVQAGVAARCVLRRNAGLYPTPGGRDADRGEAVALGGQLIRLGGVQIEIGCGHVVTQLIERTGAGNRDDVGLSDQPSERDLRGCCVVGPSDSTQCLDERSRSLEVLRQAQRIVATRGSRREVGRVVPTAEHALLEWAVRDDDTIVGLGVRDIGDIGFALEQAEVHLVREDRAPELTLGGTPAIGREVAHPDVVHRSCILEPTHALHRRTQRHERVGPVHLIQVDRLDAEAKRRQAAVLLHASCSGPYREHLGRKERLAAAPFERTPHDRLRHSPCVDLGRVDEIHAEVERGLHQLDRGGLAVGLAVAPVARAELPATQPNG